MLKWTRETKKRFVAHKLENANYKIENAMKSIDELNTQLLPWSKILNSLKSSDMVVVITNHISHDNMWRVKRDIHNLPVIYSEYDGVNRILEQIQNDLTDNIC